MNTEITVETLAIKDAYVFKGGKSAKGINLPQVLKYMRTEKQSFRTNFYTWNGYQLPEYNLYEITAAEDGDGIIKQIIKKKSALMFKEGWELSGKNPRTVDYIQKRFRIIEIIQRKTMDQFFGEVGDDLVRFNNAFILKVRGDFNRQKGIRPLIGFIRLAPETIRIKTDQYGNVSDYLQEMPDGRVQEFKAKDIIHFYHHRRAGFNFASPTLLPAIDDIRSLRQLEEYVELLTEQYLFPIFTLSIGTDTWPADVYEDGTTEVDVWANKINQMQINSGLVLSHRHKLEIHGFEKILPIEEYLNYFKNRVYVSAGVSSVDLGEAGTANRSTADSVTKQLIDDVKDYQRSLKNQIEIEIINELLLEEFDLRVLEPDNMVYFEFNEIDSDAMIKKENHNALMYSMYAITEDEMRKRNRMRYISEGDRSKMYNERVLYPRLEKEAEIALTKASSKQNNKSQNIAKSKQQPSNQHGQALGPTKRKSSLKDAELRRLEVILSDFNFYDPDFEKSRLTLWLFNLDFYTTQHVINTAKLNDLEEFVVSACDTVSKAPEVADQMKKALMENILKMFEEN